MPAEGLGAKRASPSLSSSIKGLMAEEGVARNLPDPTDGTVTSGSGTGNDSINEATTSKGKGNGESVEDEDEYDECDDDDFDDEDIDDDDLEPRLKYEKLSSDLAELLSDVGGDCASSLAVHPKMMAMGTHSGEVYVLDAIGNKLLGPNRRVGLPHRRSIGHLSIDHAGEFVASVSKGGVVNIRSQVEGKTDGEYSTDLNRTVHAISLDPLYAKPDYGRRFMTGDNVGVTMHEKSLWYTKQSLSKDEGPVSQIKWRGRFAAWACKDGVRIFDVMQNRLTGIIKYPDDHRSRKNRSNNDTACPPIRIAWSDQTHVFVSMGDCVRVCVIKKRDLSEIRARDLPDHKVVVTSDFTLLKDWICGIAPLEDLVVLLTVPKEQTKKGSYEKPMIQVLRPQQNEFKYISRDILNLRGYEKFSPSDYHLESLAKEMLFFIMTPKDIVLGKRCDADDHIDWLLSRKRFRQALDFAEQNRHYLTRHTVADVGICLLDALLEDARFEEAGPLSSRIYGTNKTLWQNEVYRFARLNQLRTIARFIPQINPRLDSQLYEMTLSELLETDQDTFAELVDTWNPQLYNLSAIVKPLVDRLLINPDSVVLQHALATLFGYQGKHDKSLAILLKLRDEDVFKLIREHGLYRLCQNKISDLMEMDQDEAVNLFLDKMPPAVVVSELNHFRRHLFVYLDRLLQANYEESKPYHGRLVELYAAFDKDKLLPFLKTSDFYPIQDALDVCREHFLVEEQIFVLSRMGNLRQALNLIIDQLVDIHKAVDFCKEQDDFELWHDLIDKSIDKPYFVHVLLRNIGTHVDPMNLINKIQKGQEIPGLRDCLVQIIQDYRMQVSLKEGCQRLLVSDCFSLIQRKVAHQSQSFSVQKDDKCEGCRLPLFSEEPTQFVVDWVLFRCHHVFHLTCIDNNASLCTSCHHKA